jgi:TorA maturation chaperone TorD
MNTEQTAYFKLLGSLLYNKPSINVVDALKTNEVFSMLPFAAECKLAATGRQAMEKWIKGASAEELSDKARSDYVRLFIGPGKPLAPPWGSVYLSIDKLLFTEETLKVRLFYEKYGMKAAKKYQEPDDHIGLELEFIAYLAEQSKADAAREFAAEFIAPWISRWNADVQKYSKTAYYKGLGNMAEGGLEFFMNAQSS